MSDKNEWPEVVGKSGQEALFIIKNDDPNVDAHLLEKGSCVTCDWRLDRVRIYVDHNNIVVYPPRRG